VAGSYERGTHGSAFTVFDSTHGYAALFSELHRIASHPPPALPLSLSFAPSCSLSLSARSLSLHALSTAPPLPTPDEALKQDQLSRESTSQPRTTREKSRMAMSSGRCLASLHAGQSLIKALETFALLPFCSAAARVSASVQGYLAHKKPPPRRILQYDHN